MKNKIQVIFLTSSIYQHNFFYFIILESQTIFYLYFCSDSTVLNDTLKLFYIVLLAIKAT